MSANEYKSFNFLTLTLYALLIILFGAISYYLVSILY